MYPKFRKGDDVLCINNDTWTSVIDVWKVFKVIDVSADYVFITNDKGSKGGWEHHRFINVSDWPEEWKRINRSPGTRAR